MYRLEHSTILISISQMIGMSNPNHQTVHNDPVVSNGMYVLMCFSTYLNKDPQETCIHMIRIVIVLICIRFIL